MDSQTYSKNLAARLTRVALILLLVAAACSTAWGQEDRFVVERVRVVDQTKPVYNIYVDENNHKWISNATTIYYLEAKDVAEEIQISPSEQSLLQLPGGDYDVRWNRAELKGILGEAKVTCAAYDQRSKDLWIGTDGYGIFRIKVDGGLRLAEQMHIDNSKLRTDFINSIFISPKGKIWIATQDGALLKDKSDWKVLQKFFNIQTISGDRTETWAIGDGLVWIIDARDHWTPIEINKREIEGSMHDIALDHEGRIWIASNIMTSYKIQTGRYQHFGPGQYFTSQFVNYVSVDHDGTIWVGTDDKGVYIIEKESTITVTTNIEEPLDCRSDNPTATVSARAIGGTEQFTFRWSTGAEGSRLAGIGPGVYTVTVTDTDGTSKSESIEIADPTIVVETKQEQPESGVGASDGIASFVARGGTPAYTCVWSTGATAPTLTGLTAGTYRVTVTDVGGCTGTGEVTITTQIDPLEVAIEEVASIQCNGDLTGALDVQVTGGRPPLTAVWNTPDLSGTSVSGLPAGMYTVTVTDAEGATAMAEHTLRQPPAITVSIDVSQAASANEANGRATAIPTGSSGYSYLWSNGETTQTATRLAPGLQEVTVTDANGCTVSTSVSIGENILPLRVSVSETAGIQCPGESTGALLAEASGGKAPYTYQWNTGNTQGATLDNLAAGTYTVTVTDAAGGTNTQSFTLKQPAMLNVDVFVDAASAGNDDGRVRAVVQGGSGAYTFAWDNGESGAEATAVSAGDHALTVTDANGCTASVSFTVDETIRPMEITLTRTEQEILCYGDATAALTVQVQGGKRPYSYQWDPSEYSGNTVQNVPAGTYRVTVSDVNGNTVSDEITIHQPVRLTAEVQVVQAASTNSSDGSARAIAQGGSGDKMFTWSNGASGATAEGLAPGEYTVTVTDVLGCSATATVTITEDILPLSLQLEQTREIPCHGEGGATVDARVAGGKGPFQFAWNGQAGLDDSRQGLVAGTYQVLVTDAVGNTAQDEITINQPDQIAIEIQQRKAARTNTANGSAIARVSGGTGRHTFAWDNGETEAQAEALDAGEHSITVTDGNGCTVVGSIEITEDIQPMSVSVEQTTENDCFGASAAAASVSVEGGKGPYTYSWSGSGQTDDEVTGLAAGQHVVTVTDATGTTSTGEITIGQPEPLVAEVEVRSAATANAADGSARVRASGGSGRYTYAWSNGSTGRDAEGLPAGDHAVTVTDEAGCTTTSTVTITEDILPLTVSIEQTSYIACYGDATAAAQASVAGGKGPFQYAWSGSPQPEPAAEIAQMVSGTYMLTVTDAVGSTAVSQVKIEEPPPITVATEVVRPASVQAADGSARVTASGGTGDFTYAWDNGENERQAAALSAGTHTVTVSDGAGCTATAEVTITENILPLSVSVEQSETILCAGDETARVTANRSGGKPPFTYAWSDGSNAETLTGVGAGEYTLTLTDATGTKSSVSISVTEPAPLVATAQATAPASTGNSDGQATATATGGRAPYRYTWDNGEAQATATALAPGERTVTVEDANGCTTTTSVTISENILTLDVTIEESSSILCSGDVNGSLTAVVRGGKEPYQAAWSNAGSGMTITAVGAGFYSVTATDDSGQSATAEYTLEAPEALECTLSNIRPAAAEHVSDGRALAEVTGGTPPYRYAWDNGETEPQAVNLGIGDHSVTVTDANGCTTAQTFEITQKILPELTAETLQSGREVRLEKLQFDADSSNVNEESKPTLNELYQFLYDNPTIVVEIGGHTNGLPEHDYCDSLSTARAKAVAEYIVQLGIDGKRVYYKGYGKRKPIATNHTPEGRRKNQRVEVRIVRLEE